VSGNATTITACLGCRRKLRVPADRSGTVTCTACRRMFDWEPERPEITELRFRCAIAGRSFVMVFGRQRQSEQFTLRHVDTGGEGVVATRYRALAGATGRAKSRGYRIERPAPRQLAPAAFDFSTFVCPHCRFQPTRDIGPFVVCSTCDELVCGARVVSAQNGGFASFRCHDACGARGTLNGGPVTALAAFGLAARPIALASGSASSSRLPHTQAILPHSSSPPARRR